MPLVLLPTYDLTLYFPLALGEVMSGTTTNTSTSVFPSDVDEEMNGTVSNTATISFPVDVSD